MALLSPSQSVLVKCNRALLLMNLNHMSDVVPIVETLLEMHPNYEVVKITHAVMLAKQNQVREQKRRQSFVGD